MMKSFFELKKLVIGPSDLNETFHYFFDLMDNPLIDNSGELITKYEAKHTPEIKSLLSAVSEITGRFLNKKIKLIGSKLVLIKHEKFIHGCCNILPDNSTITILYFNDVKSCVFHLNYNGENEYFRFSMAPSSHSKVTVH